MLSGAILGLCALTALLMRNRPGVLVMAFATLRIVLPDTVVREAALTYRIHPATIVILFGLTASVLFFILLGQGGMEEKCE